MKPERVSEREYARRWRAKLTPAEREERRLKQRAYWREWWRQRDRRAEKAAYNREWRRRLRDEEAKVNAAVGRHVKPAKRTKEKTGNRGK